ncbi:putative immunoglobulin-blocking virulence protein [Mycoplasma phocoeninasale]|uniref:Putative immunoglobulin-blocking virulence protein n=1 Tax=Mycoplasma phocoeninasale TaxID=2726117 RepID=A0A858U4S5_9MOLU|nr:putative immunoglobulin-blocking virulence protein [Mycoplasma phocoeninasale]QJG66265.1 putative immunoglobulin-blocking virulence protein [Mycoplasma phocoeninasale]
MGILKKRKNKILLGVFAAVAASAVAVGVGLYILNSHSRNKLVSISSSSVAPNLINKNNLNISDADSSIVDRNLKEINKEQLPPKDNKPNQENNKIPETKPKEEKKPEKKEIIPNVEIEDKKEENKQPDDTTSDDIVDRIIDFNGVKIKIRVKKITRKIEPKYQHLANRDPYINNPLGKLISIEVTDELRQQNEANAQNAFKNKIPKNVLDQLNGYNEIQEKAIIRQNKTYYENLFEKYMLLFDAGDKVKPFLTKHGQEIYDEQIKGYYEKTIKELDAKLKIAEKNFEKHQKKFKGNDDPGFDAYSKEFQRLYDEIQEIKEQKKDAKNHKYIQLIKNLDYTKFKVTSSIQENLSKGFVIDANEPNVFVNENGELDSRAISPLLNDVIARNERDNTQKRIFGIPGHFGRTPNAVEEGSYEGWIKSDETYSPEFQFLNIQTDEGIKIEKLTKDPNSKLDTKIDSGYVVTIDASNPKGYRKTLEIIKELISHNKKITSYRIKNIGLVDKNQQFFEIFKALPEHLPQLELFFESTNTAALLALENKKIDELSIYTSGNSLSESWSLNPYAFRGVAWYNNLDYNVSREYNPNTKITSRVTFESIGFEESDYAPDLKRINDGLKIAYWIRNNEPVFQGSLGPGLDPDNNERNNSYPTGLDLTKVKSLKSLRGLQFKRNETDPENTKRRLRRLGLYNNGKVFSIDVDELNEAQFNILDTNPNLDPPSKIYFSNSFETRRINVTNLKNKQLTPEGRSNLRILLNFSKDNFKKDTKIEINMSDKTLVNDLAGFNITEYNAIELA